MKVDWKALAEKDMRRVKAVSAPLGWLGLGAIGCFLMLSSVCALNVGNNALLAGVNQTAIRLSDNMIDASQICYVAMAVTLISAIGSMLGARRMESGVSFRRWLTLTGLQLGAGLGLLIFLGGGAGDWTTADRCMIVASCTLAPGLAWLVGVLLPETPTSFVPRSPVATSNLTVP